MYKLLLVGAGQLGSRYLQGMVSARSQLDITVVDPSLIALGSAKDRWTEAGGECCNHRVTWSHDLPSKLDNIDLAIVATPSHRRASLVELIGSKMTVRFWILEKVLAQSVADVATIVRATALSHQAWVNTPRRSMLWHQSLKMAFEAKGPAKVEYSGGSWGLACNSIHFLDLISWWTNETLLSVDPDGLDPHWFESKRSGYFDVTGKLDAYFSNGSTLSLVARNEPEPSPLHIEFSDGTSWSINEGTGMAASNRGDRIDGHMELQSQLSGRLVEDILLRNRCDLPTLDASGPMHALFLKAMLSHWNSSQKRDDAYVPIT